MFYILEEDEVGLFKIFDTLINKLTPIKLNIFRQILELGKYIEDVNNTGKIELNIHPKQMEYFDIIQPVICPPNLIFNYAQKNGFYNFMDHVIKNWEKRNVEFRYAYC